MILNDPVNILLVDDQPSKLLSYEIILSELGERLVKAGSAREALQHLLKTEIAVILIDVCMPELDGIELAKMIREHPRYQHIPIIFVSAIQVSDLDSLRGYEVGAVDYVPVPVEPDVLRAKVRVFAELFRKTRALERLNSELEARVRERTAALEASAAALLKLNNELEARIEERTRQRETALAQLFEAQKIDTIGQLTGGVAHDFNNLLMAILGSLTLLKKKLPKDPRAERLLDIAVQGAERGAALTRRLLAFARRQELKPEVVDVRELISGIEELLRRAVGPAILIRNEIPGDLSPISIDSNQLELALLNLAVNARDAMQAGGVLTITGERRRVREKEVLHLSAGTYVLLRVIDTGEGMDTDTLAKATEPFFTTKGVGKGTGLGLSMVHGLAAQSGGTLQLASKIGVGTTITLWLPEANVAAAPEPVGASRDAVVALNGRLPELTILLVDDDPLVCTGTAAMIEDMGHVVIEAHSAREALAILESGQAVDVLITDYAMPEMTGLELARWIGRTYPSIPTVLASGYADLAAADEPEMRVPRLSKPFVQEDVEAVLLDATNKTRLASSFAD